MRPKATRRANRNGFLNGAQEKLSYELSKQFGKLLGTYVDPHSFTFNAAYGYWAHNHQDVQRIAGHFRVGGMTYSFGTWDHTCSELARHGTHIVDERGNRFADNMFRLEKGPEPTEHGTMGAKVLTNYLTRVSDSL